MTIIIPMAGLSQRFINEGYTLPKYMLYIGNRSMFNLSVSSFKKYFKSAVFIFIARDIFESERFIKSECHLMGIKNFKIVIIDYTTKGQAETVYIGINKVEIPKKENIFIFNIDTIRLNFSLPSNISVQDGYLEVFEGSGKNWSYAEPLDNISRRVKRTAEKVEISNLCSTGLYFFKSKKYFCEVYEKEKDSVVELYIAPLYNSMISNDKKIFYHLIQKEDVIFTGTPNEYIDLINFNHKNPLV
ncbi:hypothetical protein OAI16_06230 [Flavobacteriaceae bacterium]|nr:hypothetical protein [Flavobacteriaceae bacterium]|tara:strand:- start:996 stop:1727 length:732 start_codon:yes stop_codon:yes gene_type:complete